MLTLVWSYIVRFLTTLLDEKFYKAIILLLVGVTLGLLVLGNNKLSDMSQKVNSLPDSIKQANRNTKNEIYGKINNMFADGVAIFTTYTAASVRDLQTIIDYSVKSERDARLLKELIAKSASQTTHDAQKQEFKNRYLDSLKFGPIHVKKISGHPSPRPDSLFYSVTLCKTIRNIL